MGAILLSDGTYTYVYDAQNRLLSKSGSGGSTSFVYDNAGNMTSEAGPGGTVTYYYNAQNRLIRGERDDGQYSGYVTTP